MPVRCMTVRAVVSGEIWCRRQCDWLGLEETNRMVVAAELEVGCRKWRGLRSVAVARVALGRHVRRLWVVFGGSANGVGWVFSIQRYWCRR